MFTKFTGKHLCWSLFIKNGTVAKMFSFELYQIFKNIFLQNNSWRLHFLLEFTARKLYKYGVMKTTINIVDIFFWLKLSLLYFVNAKNTCLTLTFGCCFKHFVKIFVSHLDFFLINLHHYLV